MGFRLLLILIFPCLLIGQSPGRFSFQAVVYDSENKVVANKNVSVRISILTGSISGSIEYQEVHSVMTNNNGLFSLEIGNGSPSQGSFKEIQWGSAPHFLKREIDPNGGTNYLISGVSQLLSVPYSIFSSVSDTALNVPDNSPTNELQMLTISNDTIYLTNGGFVKLPSGIVDTDLQSLSTSRVGNQVSIEIERGTGITFTDNVDDADNSPTNELQLLSISNDTIYLTYGGFVKLPGDTISAGTVNGELLYWKDLKWITLNVGLPGQNLIIDENGLPKWTGDAYPTVNTVSFSSITATSVVINVNITSSGGQNVSSRGVVYNTSDNPTLANSSQVSGSGTGSFYVTINNLTPSTNYYVRGFGTNTGGTTTQNP